MSKLPFWAKVPRHKKPVVATEKGWVVEDTGEVLVSVKNLPARLLELEGLTAPVEEIPEKVVDLNQDPIKEVIESDQGEDTTATQTQEQNEDPIKDAIEPPVEVVEEKPKAKRGRKPKVKVDE